MMSDYDKPIKRGRPRANPVQFQKYKVTFFSDSKQIFDLFQNALKNKKMTPEMAFNQFMKQVIKAYGDR